MVPIPRGPHKAPRKIHILKSPPADAAALKKKKDKRDKKKEKNNKVKMNDSDNGEQSKTETESKMAEKKAEINKMDAEAKKKMKEATSNAAAAAILANGRWFRRRGLLWRWFRVWVCHPHRSASARPALKNSRRGKYVAEGRARDGGAPPDWEGN